MGTFMAIEAKVVNTFIAVDDILALVGLRQTVHYIGYEAQLLPPEFLKTEY